MIEPFVTVVADPPWSFTDKLPGPTRGAEKNYRVLDLPAIEHFLKTEQIQVAADARLFLWRVASMQEEALAVVRAWGFVVKSELVWVKKTSTGKRWFGMGRQVRAEHETCLIATRGRPLRLSASERSTFEAEVRAHSEKPDEFYRIVERISPWPRVDIFARKRRHGWTSVGDELDTAERELALHGDELW